MRSIQIDSSTPLMDVPMRANIDCSIAFYNGDKTCISRLHGYYFGIIRSSLEFD